MIDFACKKFELSEIIKCSLGINKSGFKVMDFMIKNRKEYSSVEIQNELGFDLSTVQRALKTLNDKSILLRSQKNMANGGYAYYYKANAKNEIKKIIMQMIENWALRVEKEIDGW